MIPSPSVKIQILTLVCLRCKGKTLLGMVNKPLKTWKTKSLMTSPSKVLPLHLSCPKFEFSLNTSHSAYVTTATESDGVKIDGLLPPNFL